MYPYVGFAILFLSLITAIIVVILLRSPGVTDEDHARLTSSFLSTSTTGVPSRMPTTAMSTTTLQLRQSIEQPKFSLELLFPTVESTTAIRLINRTRTDIVHYLEHDVYMNGESLRAYLSDTFNIGIGHLTGRYEPGEMSLSNSSRVWINSRRLTVELDGPSVTLYPARIEDIRLFFSLKTGYQNPYNSTILHLSFIYPDKVVDYLLRLFEYGDWLSVNDTAAWKKFIANSSTVMESQLTNKQQAERAESMELGCRYVGNKVVKETFFNFGKLLTGQLDLEETFIKCNLTEHLDRGITNGELNFRFPVPATIFGLGSRPDHWTNKMGMILDYPTNPFFVNGFYARHQTRSDIGANLFAQLEELMPHCQFAAFEWVTPIEWPVYRMFHGVRENLNLLDNNHIAGFIATNCSDEQLAREANETLTFAIDKTIYGDLARLKMAHCFKSSRKLIDFLPSIQSIEYWPDTEFSRKATIYNQLNLTHLMSGRSRCHQNVTEADDAL